MEDGSLLITRMSLFTYFFESLRELYDLESLWIEAKRYRIENEKKHIEVENEKTRT